MTTLVTDSDGSMAPHNRQSSPISRHVLLGPNAHTLPGCSANEPADKPITISHDMMQAYVVMRGPSLGVEDGEEDPLFEWIQLREELGNGNGNKPSGERRKDITRMLSQMDHVLQSDNPAGDSPRTAVFELQRPPVEHIHPPTDMDLSIHVLNACCADFDFQEDDESEEEGYVACGRISPCTFLAWTKDCKRWEVDELKASTPKFATRRRPPTPTVGDTPPSQPEPDRWPAWTIDQSCNMYGMALSPHHLVPSSPSILYTAPGIDADRMAYRPGFEDQYSRMDPVAAKALRNLKQAGKPVSDTASPAGKNEYYGYSEVEEIVTKDVASLAEGLDTEHVQAHIGQQYAAIAAAEAESTNLATTLREQTTKIRDLQRQKEILICAVWNLKQKRAEETVEKKEKRHRRIQGHFREHVQDLDYKHGRSMSRLAKERGKHGHNEEMIRDLECDIFEACFEVGLICPEEVYQELVEGEKPYAVREPSAAKVGEWLAHPELPKGNESEYTDAGAKPSPLRIMKTARKASSNEALASPSAESSGTDCSGPEKNDHVCHTPYRFHRRTGARDLGRWTADPIPLDFDRQPKVEKGDNGFRAVDKCCFDDDVADLISDFAIRPPRSLDYRDPRKVGDKLKGHIGHQVNGVVSPTHLRDSHHTSDDYSRVEEEKKLEDSPISPTHKRDGSRVLDGATDVMNDFITEMNWDDECF
ncbi:hypothetical protein BJ170DRAFT_711352 [Xylariales sp. AK1849]|nr:hypothetical protein BJ170DRAFT_711352 [Xylariales sp. AK1849]